MLQDKTFTLKDLSKEFNTNKFSLIHFATHGYFGKTSKETFLVTYDGKLTMDRLEGLVNTMARRGNKVEIMALSACQTAVGDERAAFGLAGIALKAGVRSTVASLWSVDDEAACIAFTEFFRQIKQPGISKAVAFQNVQKKLIGHDKYNHPAYWAPFLLIGNWM